MPRYVAQPARHPALMYDGPEDVSDHRTTSGADCQSPARNKASSSSPKTKKRDIEQDMLEVLQAIHDNGKRQIELLEAVASSQNLLDKKGRIRKRRKAAEGGQEVIRNSKPRKTDDESCATWNAVPFIDKAVDLFTSTDEDDKLSKIIILGIMGAGSSSIETFDVADQSWDFLWRGRYETHISVLVTLEKRWDYAVMGRPDKLRRYLEDLRTMREQLESRERNLQPCLSLRRGGNSIRLKFAQPYSDSDQLDSDVAAYIMQNWHKGIVTRFWPYAKIIGGNADDFDYARRLEPVPVRFNGHNIFQFQQMGMVMEFMGVQAPGGPTLVNLQEVWEFILVFVCSWKVAQRVNEPYPSRDRILSYPQWISPNDSDQVTRLALCHLKHMMRVFSPLHSNNRSNPRPVDSVGLQMSRVTGGLERTGTMKTSQGFVRLLELTEKRVGLMMTTTVDRDPPVFRLFCLADWEVHGRDIYKNISPDEVMTRRWYRGIALFQEALLDCFEFWNTEWERTMNAIDAELKVQVSFDPIKLFPRVTVPLILRSSKIYLIPQLGHV